MVLWYVEVLSLHTSSYSRSRQGIVINDVRSGRHPDYIMLIIIIFTNKLMEEVNDRVAQKIDVLSVSAKV